MKQTMLLMSEDERIQFAKECYKSLNDNNRLNFEFWIDTVTKIDDCNGDIHACFERQCCWRCSAMSHVFEIRAFQKEKFQEDYEDYFAFKIINTFCCKSCSLEFLDVVKSFKCQDCTIDLNQRKDPRKSGEIYCNVCELHESTFKNLASKFGDDLNR